MANTAQGIYTPLPQSISDSDSEKEIQIDSVHHPKYLCRKVQNGIHSFHRNQPSNGYMMANHVNNIIVPKRGFAGMSTIRKSCFIFSIMVCCLTVIVFLWVLPCSDSGTCPIRVTNWENRHEDLEFIGGINIVASAFKNGHNLALLFKRSISLSDIKGGAISILGNNGAVAWYIPQLKPLSELNCYTIDVNGDGVNDCLLLGEIGLEAIDPVSGEIFWHMHHNQNLDAISDITNLDFPVTLPDLNQDGIYELVTVMNGKKFHNKLIIISGNTGLILSNIELKLCLEANIVKYESKRLIYSCKNATDSSHFQVTLQNLVNHISDEKFEILSVPIEYNVPKDVTYVLSNHRLIVNNTGRCPDCYTDITLLDTRAEKRLWNFTHPNSYAMPPISFVFKSTDSNMSSLKGHINGFTLKLWQWMNYKPQKNKKLPNMDMANSTVQVNSISERIVLITFNNSHVHVINASLTDIIQLCFPVQGEYVCQPDLMNQVKSLLISDLDNDGSQELVSYSSTFVSNKENWKLFSNMKVLRLEAELPKLYEVAK